MTLSHSYNISLSLKKSSNVLIPTVLGGRIARSVTRIIIDRYMMSQGQVNDIKNNTLADVTVTGH